MTHKPSESIILKADSYKYSQYLQYPEGTEYIYSYIESRGGAWDQTVFFGLQGFIKQYLLDPITQEDIDYAEELVLAHGEPFNRAGWEYILNEYNGYLPIQIKALPEGTVIDTKQVLATIVNTDPNCFWLTSFLETPTLRGIWYPTTVATNSFESKKIILEALETSGDPALIDFKLHDFGARGVSSDESAGIGGAAHLVNFMGSDTVSALVYIRNYYNDGCAGFSIPAMEHSTVTSWGRDRETDSYRNMLQKFGRPGSLLACVSDSYDIYNACKIWGTVLKDEVIASGATVVIRPDSGDPATVVLGCVRILDEYFGSTTNTKGYKVLNTVRVIQGDGINHDSIREILKVLLEAGYSADNVAFGQGGALLQILDRDTLRFAMKCSAARINGVWVDVCKDPITDTGKRSKKGRLVLLEGRTFKLEETQAMDDVEARDMLKTVYLNGSLTKDFTFAEIRANANQYFVRKAKTVVS